MSRINNKSTNKPQASFSQRVVVVSMETEMYKVLFPVIPHPKGMAVVRKRGKTVDKTIRSKNYVVIFIEMGPFVRFNNQYFCDSLKRYFIHVNICRL